MRFLKLPVVVIILLLALIAIGLRVVFFGISTAKVPESSDESLSILQAKMIIEEGRRPLLVMANPYQFPVESYLHVPFVKILPRNAFGARIIPFILSLAATVIFIITLLGIARLQTAWPALLLILFPSAYLLMLSSAYFIPQHSSFTLFSSLALCLALRMRTARSPGFMALASGFCAGLAFSNHILAIPLLIVLSVYTILGPKLSSQLRIIPAFSLGLVIGLIPYLLAVLLIPGSYGTVSGTISLAEALRRLWGPALNSALTGVMGINPCLFPDNRNILTLIPGFGTLFAILWILILLTVTALRTSQFIRRIITTHRVTLEINDVLTGLAWIGFLTYLFSARSLSHTYRYLLPVAWAFPFMVSYLYARSPKAGRIIIGGATVLLVIFNAAASIAIMRAWTRPGFAEKEAGLFDLKPAIEYLNNRGIQHAYATYWLVYRLAYETDGHILCSQPINERFPGWPIPYKHKVDDSTNAVFIMAPKMKFDQKRFENDLAVMNIACHKESFGRVSVYSDFDQEKKTPCSLIPAGQIRVTASYNESAAVLLTDDNPRTFWEVTDSGREELWIQLDLTKPEMINRIVISHTGFPDEFVGLSKITGRTETGWIKVVENNTGKACARFEYRNGHPVYSTDALIFNFTPFKTDALRLMIHNPTKNCKRVIGDIKLYRTNP